MQEYLINFILENQIPYLNVNIVSGGWSIKYPYSSLTYVLFDENGLQLLEGSWRVPQDVISQWTDNDDVITDALLVAQPWIIQQTTNV